MFVVPLLSDPSYMTLMGERGVGRTYDSLSPSVKELLPVSSIILSILSIPSVSLISGDESRSSLSSLSI